ncbi:MAG: serine/threonine protein kinase [Candidatus Aminicenantes bacterium]|nr:serine/threonine protein kinase [Candidatus Aminicenantes bacterium]
MERIGKYDVIRELGKGAMGIVYEARDPDLKRDVAIKTIRFDLFPEENQREILMKRFMNEAQAAGRLSHPNIITVYDIGRQEDMTYIVMQYIKGMSLQSIMASKKKVAYSNILNIMEKACLALDYAHEKGIVHRDIKPGNIMMSEEGEPFIADFGIARVETSTMTQTGTIMGTLSYMSPEQIEGKKVDGRTDIFSLGVILYELLTGKMPFEGDNVSTTIYKIMNKEPEPLNITKKDIPSGFQHIINKALAKNPEERYQSCREFVKDLRGLPLTGDETLAYDVKTWQSREIEKKPIKKRALLWASAAASVLLAAAAGIWFFFIQKKPSSNPDTKSSAEITVALPENSRTDPEKIIAGAAGFVSESFQAELDEIRRTFEAGSYQTVIDKVQEILKKDETNEAALQYLKRAEDKINEGLISGYLIEGKEAYQKRDFAQTKILMRKITAIDKDHAEALRYYDLSDQSQSKPKILAVVENQRKAEENEDLLSLLSDIGADTVASQKKEDAVLLFNGYNDIKSVVSDVSVSFQNNNSCTVTFSHLLTGVYRLSGKRKILFEGKKTWRMVRQSGSWKIMSFR